MFRPQTFSWSFIIEILIVPIYFEIKHEEFYFEIPKRKRSDFIHRLGAPATDSSISPEKCFKLPFFQKKMSHPIPSEKPTNPENPRVFLDVDIGGERGLLIFKNSILVRTFGAVLA